MTIESDNIEVIELNSDEDEVACKDNCVNIHCKSGVGLKQASLSVCRFFGSEFKKIKKRYVCKACFTIALNYQTSFTDAIKEGKPLLSCKIMDHSSKIEISSSEESDQEESYTPDTEFQKHFDSILPVVSNKYNFNTQVKESYKILERKLDKLNEKDGKLNKHVDSLINEITSLKTQFCSEFPETTTTQEEVHIIDLDETPANTSGKTNIQDNKFNVSSRTNKIGINKANCVNLNGPVATNFPRPNVQRKIVCASSLAFKRTAQTSDRINYNNHDTSSLPSPQVNKIAVKRSFPNIVTKKAAVESMKFITTKPPTFEENQPEILELHHDDNITRKINLPPRGQLKKPIPNIKDTVLMLKNMNSPWVQGEVQLIISRDPLQFRVKHIREKFSGEIKTVTGNYIALKKPSPVIIPHGTRVVAAFEDDSKTKNNNIRYYPGIIAEPPKSINRFRYLIFFDDGYVQYVVHEKIYVICESSPRVWEDVPDPLREFIRRYVLSYPERAMVKLQVNQVVTTEWNNEWCLAQVAEIDASLVKMYFPNRMYQWIYRGSTRFQPLLLETVKARMRQQGKHPLPTSQIRRSAQNNRNGGIPYVEYTCNNGDDVEVIEESISITQPPLVQKSRAVAKKSTAKKIDYPLKQHTPKKTSMVHSLTEINNSNQKTNLCVMSFAFKNSIRPKKYSAHQCSPDCVKRINEMPDDLRGSPPLAIPLLCGWNRQTCIVNKTKKNIMYVAPCGRRLKNMKELHKYLMLTKCSMSVDLFDFDAWVHCLEQLTVSQCFINLKDISYGVENVPINCVNELDRQYPAALQYSTKRLPDKDVIINTDPDFLICCECEDDCQDKSKCPCWQLTVESATLRGKIQLPLEAIGYVYKRLPEIVMTGIYECNSRCKCNVKTCLNRVVQHPMSLKLQLFYTKTKGWGIRALNDIPSGSFICIYAGKIFNENKANENGRTYGDEYFAEIDFIEAGEDYKQGYESDVIEPETISEPKEVNKAQKSMIMEEEEIDITDDSDYKPAGISNDNEKIINIDEDSTSRYELRKRLKKDDSIDKSEGEKEFDSDDDENQRREPRRLDVEIETLETNITKSAREYFGEDGSGVYVMDAKTTGNLGRWMNHSCDPNVFVQNVFVDTQDIRFPWISFFASRFIRAGQELTWNYQYDIGSVPGKKIICMCGAVNCKGRLL